MRQRQEVARGERGYVLIVAVSLTAMVTLLGYLMLQSVWATSRTVYSGRQSESALHMAEAGLAWGASQLNTLNLSLLDFDDTAPYALNGPCSDNYPSCSDAVFANSSDPDFSNFSGCLTCLAEVDCLTGDDECPCELTGWRPLANPAEEDFTWSVYFPDGTDSETSYGWYRVAFRDDDDGDGNLNTDTNQTVLLRSYGVTTQGSRRLLEATVTGDPLTGGADENLIKVLRWREVPLATGCGG
jgi:Tfp pilus assembly protein PilX